MVEILLYRIPYRTKFVPNPLSVLYSEIIIRTCAERPTYITVHVIRFMKITRETGKMKIWKTHRVLKPVRQTVNILCGM
jgi:hypothetical protein